MTEPVNTINVGQADYMKLFMQELTYQDPLKPVDNREFMAQMAQFSSLQQAVTTNEGIQQLLTTINDNQGINLLGKYVKIAGTNTYGEVKAVYLHQDKPTEVRVLSEGESLSVNLNQIIEVDV